MSTASTTTRRAAFGLVVAAGSLALGLGAGTASAAPVSPLLGSATAQSQGLGTEHPSTIDPGGDSNGIVTDAVWSNWGAPTATGSGTADRVAPGAPLASGTPETATLVATDLGDCHGRLAYRSLGRYFPQHGETAPASFQPICS